MPDDARDLEAALVPDDAPPGAAGPVAVPEPERLRMLTDFAVARARYQARPPDAERYREAAALDALAGAPKRSRPAEPERAEADLAPAAEHKLPEHLVRRLDALAAAAAARTAEHAAPAPAAEPRASGARVPGRMTWADAHGGGECPAARLPTAADLAEWLPVCPVDVWEATAAAERVACPDAIGLLSVAGVFAGADLEDAVNMVAATLSHVASVTHRLLWYRAAPPRPLHPLRPLVDGWQRLAPVWVSVETRADRRIMPALRVVGPTTERERGKLFGGLVDNRPREVNLTLFPHLEPERLRVPLLEIVDASGVPLRSRGAGAPIEARLIVRGGLLMLRPEDRERASVRIAVTVGELMDGLYPTKRRISKNWPKIEAALRSVRDFTVPDQTGGRWFPMALRRLPAACPDGKPPALDDRVILDLAPPPGGKAGASIDLPELDRMGVSSGPKWYAYIAGRSPRVASRQDSAPGAATARQVRLEHRSE